MSEATLNSLLDYLYGTLSPSNMLWVAEHLVRKAKHESESLKPYTLEELHSRIEKSERDSAEGKVYDFDDVMREIEEEFAFDEEIDTVGAI